MAQSKGKKSIYLLSASVVVVIILLTGTSFALSIVGSKHDFSSTGRDATPFAEIWFGLPDADGFPTLVDEVCVFCHTPHGASKNVPGLTNAPLWNRTNSPHYPPNAPVAFTYAMYSSATFSGFATRAAAPTGISMMCMSCHDGVTSIAINTLLNPPGSANPDDITHDAAMDFPGAIGNVYNDQGFLGWGANLGDNYPGSSLPNIINLSNDHPISFAWPSGMTGTKLNDPAGIDARLRLFGDSRNRIECATCHQVHDPLYPPFLSMPNTNSGMCLSCHIK